MSDDYTKDYIEDVAKSLGGKQPGDVAEELKKQLSIREYIDAATEGMGGKQKSDVARELRTHILDSADALAAERRVPVDDVIIREVLGKMGPAKKIAAMYPEKKTILQHGMVKALLSLAGIAMAFLVIAGILWVVSPETLQLTLPGQEPAGNVLSVVLSVVGALSIAIVVIAVIFLAMYVYETSLRKPYEARRKGFEKSLKRLASPLHAAGTIIGTLIWLFLLNVFWRYALFVQSFQDNTAIIPALTEGFAPFVTYFNVLGVLAIVLAVAYLIIRPKWISLILDSLLALLNGLLFIWILAVFPFNGAMTAGPVALIKLVLAFIVFGCLVDAAKHLWNAIKSILYGRVQEESSA